MRQIREVLFRFIPIAVVLILLLSAGLRLHLLGAQSLWHDEGNSYVQATRSFAEIAENASNDIHPPGYYWLLAVWHRLTGESEFALRSLSVFASIISVALTYALGLRLYGHLSGLVAAMVVALNTFSIYYAQETRMYALLVMWSVASMWAFIGFMQALPDDRWKWCVGFALLNTAGLYTQYAFPFVMLTQGFLIVLWVGWQVNLLFKLQTGAGLKPAPTDHDLIRLPTLADILHLVGLFVAFNLLTILLYLPWIQIAWEQITHWPNTGDPTPFVETIPVILARLSFGITVENGTTAPIFFFLLFGLLVFPASRLRASEDIRQQPVWWWMLIPVAWVLLTVGMFLATGLFRDANLKFLLPAQVGFALWIGRGVWVLWTLQVKQDVGLLRYIARFAAVFGITVFIISMISQLSAFYTNSDYQRDDYRSIVSLIETQATDADAIILSAPNQQEVFEYYYDGALPIFALPRGLGGNDEGTLSEVRAIIDSYDRVFAVLWATEERDPNNIVESTLDSEAFEMDSTWYGNVRLVRYATPVEFTETEPLNVQFGEHIILESVAISTNEIYARDVLQVQFTWTTNDTIDTRYKIFVQLLAPDGFVVTQHDSEPQGGLLPTVNWIPNDLVIDNHALVIPSELSSGEYTLIMGVYDINDPLARLRVNEGDHLILQTFEVP